MNEMMVTAVRAAIQAGESILEIYDQDFDVEIKSDNSPLTTADKASHRIIEEALQKTAYPVLSEESARIEYATRKQWEMYWLVDPLDGTKEFIKKNGEFTVNIALIENGKPVFGVVYVPVQDTLYCGLLKGDGAASAWKSIGCFGKSIDEIRQAAEPLSVSGFPRASDPRALRIVASKSHCNDETRAFIEQLEEQYGAVELVSSGSSLKLCMVAEGSADIYPRIAPTMEWDTAAAHAVVIAAGGAVFEYERQWPVSDYSASGTNADSGCATPGALRYNKENLLNPYFIVSGLGE